MSFMAIFRGHANNVIKIQDTKKQRNQNREAISVKNITLFFIPILTHYLLKVSGFEPRLHLFDKMTVLL